MIKLYKIPILLFGRESVGKNVLNQHLTAKVIACRGETSREVLLQEDSEKPKQV